MKENVLMFKHLKHFLRLKFVFQISSLNLTLHTGQTFMVLFMIIEC